MMIGINIGSSASSSLLNNFEIVATSLIALSIFRETVGKYLWTGIFFITSASIILSFDVSNGFSFSLGALFVLLAAICWGFENNCTRKISERSTYQIVLIKGLGSGSSSFIIALIVGESLPGFPYAALAMLLGFASYGLSIFAYVKAQRYLGAAKTSAFYALAPFIGTLLSFVLVGESVFPNYWIALAVMVVGVAFVIVDTLKKEHCHGHHHLVTHTHGGSSHSHRVYHEHDHVHLLGEDRHSHHHSEKELKELLHHNGD